MRLVIIGAGGYGNTIADIAEQSGRYETILFLDDNNKSAQGKCDEFTDYIDSETEIYPAFGNNELRMSWIQRLKEKNAAVSSLIHASAYISPTVELGEGTMVLPNACIGTNCRIGRGCIINMNAVIDHDCLIEDGVHIGLGTVLKAGVRVKENTKIDAGDVIKNN